MTLDRWVVLDDTDPSIKYIGSWYQDSGTTLGNYGPPYHRTLHGTTANATMEFEFDGTGIAASGTNYTNPDSTFECFIDNVSIGKETPSQLPLNNHYLCRREHLSDAHHIFRIDVEVVSSDQKFWLDQLRYIPSPNSPLDNKTMVLENTDPAILFDSQWTEFGASNITREKNSIAKVNFIGTSITWVGISPVNFPHPGASGTWAIDDGKETQFILSDLPETATTTIYNQFYFTTPDVEAGPHILTVTFHGDNTTTPLCIDYLYIKNGTFPLSTSVNGTASQESPPQESSPQELPPQDPKNSDNGGKSSQRRNAGAILGGVLGGFAFLIIIAGAILFWRHRKTKLKENFLGAKNSEFTPTPFQHKHDNHSNSTAQANQPQSYSPHGISASKAARLAPPPIQRRENVVRKQQEALGQDSEAREMNNAVRHAEAVNLSASPGPQATTTDTSAARQHIDSGVRLNAEPPLDIPPHYTPN